MQHEPFSIAIVGAGGTGELHADAVERSAGVVRLAAVIDRDTQAAQALAERYGAASFASSEDMLGSGLTPDGIFLCTPPTVRLALIKSSFEAGMHVLVENPLATSLGVAAAIEELHTNHPNSVAACGYCHRFAPAITEIKRMLRDGEFGRLLRFKATFASNIPDIETSPLSDPAHSGGGALMDAGSHAIDLMQYLVGQGEPIASIIDRPWEGRGEAAATVLLSVEPDIAASIHVGWTEPRRSALSIVGTDALAYYDYDHPDILRIIRSTGEIQHKAVVPHDVMYHRQLVAFVARTRGLESDLASFADALAAERIVKASLQKAIDTEPHQHLSFD